jgi:hypothetical protein
MIKMTFITYSKEDKIITALTFKEVDGTYHEIVLTNDQIKQLNNVRKNLFNKGYLSDDIQLPLTNDN